MTEKTRWLNGSRFPVRKLLNITTLTAATDYLGQLYETFFRFTGGNTIGQYFTPRHIADFMTELCNVSRNDKVLDPTCGTGGFLISSLYKMGGATLSKPELSALVSKHLKGYESEPITAALCVANMIIRGDGATGIVKEDCFTSDSYPIGKMTVVLGNPPFPHKKTDDPPEKFVDRGLEALETRGRLAMLVPSSLLSKNDKRKWRKNVLKNNTLLAVIKVPDELFQPYASSYADIVVLEKGIPHDPYAKVFFSYIADDGYKIKKGVRVKKGDGDLRAAINAYKSKKSIPGLCTFAKLQRLSAGGEWGPGLYVKAKVPTFDEIKDDIYELVRNQIAFQVSHADKLTKFQEALDEGRLTPQNYRDMTKRKPVVCHTPDSLGSLFDIYYGQKSLHNKSGLAEGESLIISSKGTDNGCYGFFHFDELIEPAFVSAPGNGTIGEASVQLWPCGVADDCILLFPRQGTLPEELWTAAAVVRRERWRFHYGFKLTPERVMHYLVPRSVELTALIRSAISGSMPLARQLGMALSPNSGNATVAPDMASEFSKHSLKWKEETKLLPTVAKRSMHPSYQRIVGMGRSALPFILKDLQDNGPNDWFWALTAITSENPITENIAGDMSAMTEAWLQWGTRLGFLSDSHQKTSGTSRNSTKQATE